MAAKAGAAYVLTEKWGVDALGRFTGKSYQDDAVASESDETRADGQLMFLRRLQPTLTVNGFARYSDFAFESSRNLDRDFTSWLFAVGGEVEATPSIKIGAAAGVQTQDFSDNAIDPGEVPYGNIWVHGRTTPALRLTGEATHGLRDADAYPYASQIYTDVRGKAELDVVPQLTTLALSVTYRLSSYEDQIPGSASADEFVSESGKGGEETRWIVEGSAKYRVTPVTEVVLAQRYEDSDSDVSEPFKRNTTKLLVGRDF